VTGIAPDDASVMKHQPQRHRQAFFGVLMATAVISLALTACSPPFGGNCTPKGGSSGTAATTVNVVSDSQNVGAYAPKDISVQAGQAVSWSWQDQGNQHSVSANDGSFESCLHNVGYVFTVAFAKPGTYAYRCSIHSQMTGQITVA
jgi:plastocyanin